MRRGKPSGNSIWGDEVAVLMGDLIYSRASEMMAATGNLEIVKTFANAIKVMSEGEILQLENLYNLKMSQETYFKILSAKTGALIGSACKASGLLAAASPEQITALFEFGKYVGIAFQLIDDAIDYTSTTEDLGKNQFTDIEEGKLTLPLLMLLEKASTDEIKQIESCVHKEKLTRSDTNCLLELLSHYQTPQETLKIAHQYTVRAIDYLNIFPESEERSWLQGLATILTKRHF